MESKAWYLSKGVWGSGVAVAAGLAGIFGYHLDAAMQGDVVDWLVSLGAVAGAALGLYGRLTAAHRIQ